MARDIPTLAVPFDPTEERRASGLVLGADSAVQSFSRALVEHGTLARYTFFTATDLVAAADAKLRQLAARRAGAAARIEVLPQAHIGEMLASDELYAYHEPGFAPDVMFRMRATAAHRPFPITLQHHTFSYRRFLHDALLRLLLADTRPYDSLICSSRAAHRALSELLSWVAERFEAEHGVSLSYRGRMDVVPLGVDTELWRPRDRADARAQTGLPRDATIVLYLGRFSAVDKCDLVPLIDVFVRLARELPDANLLFVLAGTPRQRGLDVVESHVAHTGLGDRVRIIRAPRTPQLLMSAADVFVSPSDSIQEAYGLTPVEAMASGVPQVVADWNGYRDTVVDSETGFLVPTMWSDCDGDVIDDAPLLAREYLDHLAVGQSVAVDPVAMHHSLRTLIENPTLRRTMGEASRRRAERELSSAVVTGRYEQLWSELSAAARADSRRPTTVRSYADPPYWRAFGHYASHPLTSDDRVRIRPRGADVVDGEAALVSYYDGRAGFDRALAAELLAIVAAAGGESSIGEAEDRLRQQRSCQRSRARRHLLWLVKYALLEVVR